VGLLGCIRVDAAAPATVDDPALRKKALALNEITGAGPMQGALDAMLANPTETKKLLAVAAKMAKTKPQPFNRNATYLLAIAAENFKEVEISATFYRISALQSLRLYSERGLSESYLGLIGLYTDNKRYAESEKVCREFLAIEGEEDEAVEQLKPMVMRRMVLAIARQGAPDRALKLVDDLIKSAPSNWLHRALKAQVLREMEKLEEAAKVFVDVIERIKKDDRLEKEKQLDFISEYRYSLSGVYMDLNQVDKASEQLKLLLAQDPNNPTYNNDLGFIWADRGMNLAEAEKLIRKALEEDRKLRRKLKLEKEGDNSAYLDSLGWVLFKQGKAKEALPYLQQAVKEKEGQHIEIYDHLADVYQALGEKAEAITAWKKALETVTPSKRDQKRKVEVQKKLDKAQAK